MFLLWKEKDERRIRNEIDIDIHLFNRNWVDTRWQHYTIHLQTDHT